MSNSVLVLNRFATLIACVMLATVSATSPAHAGDEAKAAHEAHPVFYPALPDPPRIQLLATLTGEQDLRPPSSSFARFILGDENSTQQLVQPYGTAMHKGRLYVVDTGAAGVAVFDIAAQRFSYLSGAPNGQMRRPINIRIDTDGSKYITDTGRNQILVYGQDDRFVAAYGKEGQFRPTDVAIVADRLYVTDVLHHQVHVLDKRTGKPLFAFGKAGSGEGELFHPTNIVPGPEGDLYVSETSNFRVQRFTQEGKPVRSYGAVGSTPGSFARPKGLAIDRTGRMFVADAAFENVQLFDDKGKLLLFFGQEGEPQERMHLPAGVGIDYDNVSLFQKHADPNFKIEYLILVTSQFGPNKVDVYGFGRMAGMEYPADMALAAMTPR
jgi:sugar lactone lactonase YvrE